jgi:hypothetical protein
MKTTIKLNPTENRGVLRVMDVPQVLRGNSEPVAKMARSIKIHEIQNSKTPQYDLKFSASNINTTFTVPKTQEVTANESIYLKRPPFSHSGVRNTL